MPDDLNDFLNSIDSHEPLPSRNEPNEPSIENRKCGVCNKPLTNFEHNLNHVCHESCYNCNYCGNAVGLDLVHRMIKEETTEGPLPEPCYPLPVYHRPCRDEALREEMKRKPVTITQEHLDVLNRTNLLFRQIFESDENLSVETNQELTASMVRTFLVDMPREKKYRALKNMEASAAICSILIGQKNKDEIKLEIAKRDSERFQRVKEYRENRQQADEERKAVSRERAKRLDPAERQREKAIAAMMAIGMDRDEAIATIEKRGNKCD